MSSDIFDLCIAIGVDGLGWDDLEVPAERMETMFNDERQQMSIQTGQCKDKIYYTRDTQRPRRAFELEPGNREVAEWIVEVLAIIREAYAMRYRFLLIVQ
jgi:hypothetical protein